MFLLQTESGQEMRQRMVNSKLRVGELASTALVALPPVVRVSALAATLRACSHQAFPVTPEVKAALQSGAPTSGSDAPAFRVYRVLATPRACSPGVPALGQGRAAVWCAHAALQSNALASASSAPAFISAHQCKPQELLLVLIYEQSAKPSQLRVS